VAIIMSIALGIIIILGFYFLMRSFRETPEETALLQKRRGYAAGVTNVVQMVDPVQLNQNESPVDNQSENILTPTSTSPSPVVNNFPTITFTLEEPSRESITLGTKDARKSREFENKSPEEKKTETSARKSFSAAEPKKTIDTPVIFESNLNTVEPAGQKSSTELNIPDGSSNARRKSEIPIPAPIKEIYNPEDLGPFRFSYYVLKEKAVLISSDIPPGCFKYAKFSFLAPNSELKGFFELGIRFHKKYIRVAELDLNDLKLREADGQKEFDMEFMKLNIGALIAFLSDTFKVALV